MRRRIYPALTVVVSLAIALGGCSAPQVGTAEQPSTSAHEQLEEELGAFDITAEQRELAKSNEAGYEPLDAGRGNPNWINTKARYAFAG